jgi:hypothetical protein
MTLAGVSPLASDVIARVGNPEHYTRWRQQLASTGYCSQPIRLSGSRTVVDAGTGEIRSSYSTGDEPDGALLVACGNRRATRCATCSATYRADTWQLVAAGLRGGKGIPETVAEHPRLFVTLTAPSFGPVHSRRGKGRGGRVCRTRRGHCPHGRSLGCSTRHQTSDPLLGTPLCVECFDYPGLVLWNANAGELWRRTTIYLRRQLAYAVGLSPSTLAKVVRLSYTKVAEYQARGAVHFHAVIRLDAAPPPHQAGSFDPPRAPFDAEILAAAIRAAVPTVEFPLPDAGDGRGRLARWGAQLDIRVIASSSETTNPTAIAAYIAKYSTKSTEVVSGGLDRPIRDGDLDGLRVSEHVKRIVATCWRLGGRADLADLRLRKWAHMLGFRGHFASRSRRYSVTLGSLREARAAWRRARRMSCDGTDAWSPIEDQTTEVVGHWRYAGSGFSRMADFLFAESGRHSALIAVDELRQHRRQPTAFVAA